MTLTEMQTLPKRVQVTSFLISVGYFVKERSRLSCDRMYVTAYAIIDGPDSPYEQA